MGDAPDDADRAFIARATARLDEAAAARDDALLRATFRALPRPRRWLPLAATAATAAAIAAAVTWAAVAPAPAPVSPGDAAAFDGGASPGSLPPGATIARDARGRVAEISSRRGDAYDGERLVFRAGRLARIEHWRGGQLDGVSVDFDGSGRVVTIQTWVAGAASGPALELDANERVKAPGP